MRRRWNECAGWGFGKAAFREWEYENERQGIAAAVGAFEPLVHVYGALSTEREACALGFHDFCRSWKAALIPAQKIGSVAALQLANLATNHRSPQQAQDIVPGLHRKIDDAIRQSLWLRPWPLLLLLLAHLDCYLCTRFGLTEYRLFSSMASFLFQSIVNRHHPAGRYHKCGH